MIKQIINFRNYHFENLDKSSNLKIFQKMICNPQWEGRRDRKNTKLLLFQEKWMVYQKFKGEFSGGIYQKIKKNKKTKKIV